MKKTIISAFLLSIFSISTIRAITQNCYEYAMDAAGQELMHYGGTWGEAEYLSAALDYYDMCTETDGNIADPVFL
ncbi:hypothetical protein F7018_10220 [Tenacibaculum aiptasiae]|uniref:Uncharacterized protein n=1 Tax=Tenacibaculum aiptasiae TaxID=426481 RepID=A0A7J5AI63_9FLAO|nr:hypothetical protein [Tenacibaculum aiptasiae]KAB1157297.1 hypothetical protein F7018_10220 [Tenacibaculum aiptasiae]